MKRSILLAAALLSAATAHALRPDFTVAFKSFSTSVARIDAADFNLDGRPDVVVRNNQHSVLVALTAADGTIGSPANVFTGTYVTHHVVGDFDEDGDVDVVVSDTVLNTVTLLPSNGDGTFGAPIASALTFSPTEIDAGDFNNDGHLDLAARSYSASYLVVLAGDGDGAFAEVSRRPLALSGYRTAAGDLDADGKLDAVIVHKEPAFYEIHYGRGDGTFDPAATTAADEDLVSELVLADLDGDGDREIISTQFAPSTATVVLNQGARSLAPPRSYALVSRPHYYGSAYDVVAGHFNDDLHVDVAVTLASNQLVVVLPGDGSGGFGTPALLPVLRNPFYMATADFNGDGKLDIVSTSSPSGVLLLTQEPGQVDVTLSRSFPTVTQGQAARFTIRVAHRYDNYFYYTIGDYPAATGTVTLKNGSTVIATAPASSGDGFTLEVSSLVVGTHSITAHYNGDFNYRPTVSEAVTQKVIAEATTTTLTSASAAAVPYGASIPLVADVTSPVSAALDGAFRFYRNGTAMDEYHGRSGPPASTTYYAATMGTQSFHAEYLGNANQPPSRSTILQRTVRKAKTTPQWWQSELIVREGLEPSNVRIEVDTETGGHAAGTLRIYEGATLVHTTPSDTYFTLPMLSPGIHYLRAVFAGNENYESSTSAPFKYTVIAGGAFYLHSYWSSSWLQVEGWYSGPSPSYFRHYRRVNDGAWTMTQTYGSTSMSVYDPAPGTVYAFRMEAYDAANRLLAASNLVATMKATFTDDPLAPGTAVKAVHVQELLTGVNALRAAAGLGAIALPQFGAGQRIRAEHLLALRTAVNEARVALVGGPVAFTAGLAPGAPMQAVHVQELRDVLR